SRLHRPHPERCQTGRTPVPAADQVRADRESQDRQSAGPDDPRCSPGARRRGHRMKRRELITLLGSAAAAWPLAARAQQPEKGRAVAFVLSTLPEDKLSGAEPAEPVVRAFIDGLRDHGWVDGRNISIIRRTALGQRARAEAIFDELVARRVDVIALG